MGLQKEQRSMTIEELEQVYNSADVIAIAVAI